MSSGLLNWRPPFLNAKPCEHLIECRIYIYCLPSGAYKIVTGRPCTIIYHGLEFESLASWNALGFIYPTIRCDIQHAPTHIPSEGVFISTKIHGITQANIIVYTNGCNCSVHGSVGCYCTRCEYIYCFCRNSDIQHLSRDTSGSNLSSYRGIQQIGKGCPKCKAALSSDGNLSGLITGSIIEYYDNFLTRGIVSSGVREDIRFTPHFTLYAGLQASVLLSNIRQPLNVVICDAM